MSEAVTIHAIVAMTERGVIGKKNDLPWKLKGDLPRFKRLTTGQTVIMGKNTYDSIGRPLPDRYNIVLMRERQTLPGCEVCTSLPEAWEAARKQGRDTYVIGGASVYEQALPEVEILHVSHVKEDYEGDVYFPQVNWQDWREVESEEYEEFVAKKYFRIKSE